VSWFLPSAPTLVRTCNSFFSNLLSHFEKIWEVLGRELHGTFPMQLVLVWSNVVPVSNFSTYQTGPGIRVFSSSFPPCLACQVSGTVLWVVGIFNVALHVKRNAYCWWNLAKLYQWTHCRFEKYTKDSKKRKGEFTRWRIIVTAQLKMEEACILTRIPWTLKKGSGKLCIFSGSQLCSSGLTGLD